MCNCCWFIVVAKGNIWGTSVDVKWLAIIPYSGDITSPILASNHFDLNSFHLTRKTYKPNKTCLIHSGKAYFLGTPDQCRSPEGHFFLFKEVDAKGKSINKLMCRAEDSL